MSRSPNKMVVGVLAAALLLLLAGGGGDGVVGSSGRYFSFGSG